MTSSPYSIVTVMPGRTINWGLIGSLACDLVLWGGIIMAARIVASLLRIA